MARSPRPVETAEEAQQRLERLVPRMVETMREAALMAAMVGGANGNGDLHAALKGNPQVPGYNATYHAILARLVLALTSLLDSASDNRASVPAAMAILAQREVRLRLTRAATEWPSSVLPGRALRNARACVRHRRRAEAAWRAVTDAADWQERQKRLRNLRDSRLSHALYDMGNRPGPLYGWLEEIRQQLRPIVVSLCFAVLGDGGAEEDDADNEASFASEAEAFWSALRVGTQALSQEAEADDAEV